MNVLFLDDSPLRREAILEACHHNVELWCVPTVKMFRHSYVKKVFDVVCLDHDLGTRENGMDAVRFLISLPAESRPHHTLVHSANYPAAGSMIAALNDAAFTNVALVRFSDLATVLRKISELAC